MYKQIYVPVDNSEHSIACVDIAVALGKEFEAALTGSHAYAAQMHDYRFKQMEFTLPEEYLDEQELERQRKIHDSLITMGLQLISDSYLDLLERRCQEHSLQFNRKMYDGRNFQVIVDDICSSNYDLVIIGALGMGAVRDSVIGSVCERVVRRTQVDTLVVKQPVALAELRPGPIVVGIDGSPQAFAGLQTAIELGKRFDKSVEAIGVYDPFLHYVMFNSIVGVLSEKASKVFKFKEQEALHEEVIDTGLAKIYQSHLEVARRVASEAGLDLKITLLPGKAYEKVLHYVRDRKPWLLVLGRIGVHSDDRMDIGSNAENLLRLAPCNVLLSSGKFVPPIDVKADESIVWTDDANVWLERVPPLMRGIARTAIHRYAFERGHSVITVSVIEDAVGEILPEGMMRSLGIAAEKIAIHTQKLADSVTYICGVCGYAARQVQPSSCPVCEQDRGQFSRIDKETLNALVPLEGGIEEETGFDGVKLRWTAEARKMLRTVPSGYERRRAKARMEKLARVRGLATVTKAVALEITGDRAAPATTAPADYGREAEATLPWTPEAEQRLSRVPAGFMRTMTRTRVENLAREQGLDEVTLETTETAIAMARQLMQDSIGAYMQDPAAARQPSQKSEPATP
ncbi:Light-independent protochlorophyllide reductase subunit B [Candidatus Entotheonellaceae bacterium PAL068K]